MITSRRYLALLAALGVQRLIEVAYSARNERKLRRTGAGGQVAAAGVFRWIVLANLGLFTLPMLERRWRRVGRVSAASELIGTTGVLVATGLRLWAIASLRESWNVRAVVPDRLRIVDAGPYRWVRHPNYLALVIEFAAVPLVGGAYATALLLSGVNGYLLSLRIRAEEALLFRHQDYVRVMAHKPRLVPRLSGR